MNYCGASFPPPPSHHKPATPFGPLPPIQVFAEAQGQPTPKWTFERTDRQAQPVHRWEIGASAFAWKEKQRFFGYGLATLPTSFDERGFTTSLDNQETTFYQTGYMDLYRDSRLLGFRTAYLEVAHQFPKGIRLGMGVLGIMEGSRGNRRPAEAFTALGRDKEFTQVITNSARAFYATLTIQYTVFRRRRFRVSPGVSILSHLGTVNTTTSFVTVNQQVPSGSQTSFSRSRKSWAPIPSLQLQYQLTRHLALTGDLLPGMGVGVRYSFE